MVLGSEWSDCYQNESSLGRTVAVNYNFTASIAIPDLNGYDLLDAREKLDFEKSIGMYKDNNADAQINKDKDYNYKLSLVESGVNTYWLSQP